ncbi:MAG: hypothetical protein H7287_12655, partial [Thermoleophilia bacterium]|nr:hypothetical protein [Thermoleophilia bacterium]
TVLQQLKASKPSEQMLTEAPTQLQTPQAATDIAAYQARAGTGAVDPATGQPAEGAAAVPGRSAWSDAWAAKFRDTLRAQGASDKVVVTVLQQLKASKPSEQMLTEALTQLQTPEAKAAIQQLNADAKTKTASELKMNFIMMGGALVGGAAIMGIKAATGAKNLTNQISALTHDLPSKSKIATAARTALDQTASVEARTAARALTRTNLLQRAEALKLAGNASEAKAVLRAASSLKPGQAMTLKEALTFGVMYRSPSTAAGIVGASQAARSASTTSATTAAGAATKAGGAAATAAQGGAAGIEAAAKGASTLSKVGGFLGKALGPISIAVTAAFGVWEISNTVKAEGGFGKESAKKTGEVSGSLAGGIGGAAGGAALGTLLLPGPGTLIGGIIGGIIGSTGGGMLGSLFGGGIHDAIEGADGVKGAAKG